MFYSNEIKINCVVFFLLARRDHLDFVLSSTYNHCKEVFPENPDYFYQRETKSKGKWGAGGFIYFVERKEENLIVSLKS